MPFVAARSIAVRENRKKDELKQHQQQELESTQLIRPTTTTPPISTPATTPVAAFGVRNIVQSMQSSIFTQELFDEILKIETELISERQKSESGSDSEEEVKQSKTHSNFLVLFRSKCSFGIRIKYSIQKIINVVLEKNMVEKTQKFTYTTLLLKHVSIC